MAPPRNSHEFRYLEMSCLVQLLALLFIVSGASAAEFAKVRVAAISFVPKKFDLTCNAKRLESRFTEAAQNGAKIAVAPEGALEGYVVNEIIAGKATRESMNDLAVEIDSPIIHRFQKLARKLDLCLVFGLAERIGKDVFNCAVYIDNSGKIAGKQHKMQFAEGYHPDWWFNRLAKKNRAFDTPYGRAGIMICNDRWNADIARIPALDGAQYLIIPSFGSRSKRQDEAVLARGVENNLPVIEANVGVTLIVSENKIAAVDRDEEGITYGDIQIPQRSIIISKERDRVEAEFLQWRGTEMKKRYDRTMSRRKKK
jgi:predicted amidohydrolase